MVQHEGRKIFRQREFAEANPFAKPLLRARSLASIGQHMLFQASQHWRRNCAALTEEIVSTGCHEARRRV